MNEEKGIVNNFTKENYDNRAKNTNLGYNLQTASDFVDSLYFLCKIKTKNNKILVYTTSGEEIYYRDILAKQCMDFTEMKSSLLTRSKDKIKVTLYNETEVENFEDASAEIELVGYDKNPGRMTIVNGFIEQCIMSNRIMILIIKPIYDKLRKTIGEFFSEFCRAELGDSRCGVDLTPFKSAGSITGIINQRTIIGDQTATTGNFFLNGVIKFEPSPSNNNIAFETKIINQQGDILSLLTPIPYTPIIGDKFTAIAGCDKVFTTCRDKFKNIINFRGEPFLNGENLKSVTKPIPTQSNGSDKK